MRKLLAAALLAACAACGILAAAVLAETGPPPALTDTTAVTDAAVLPEGIAIAGVPVGGMPPAEAYAAIRAAFSTPVTLVFDGHRLSVDPQRLGAIGWAQRAVAAAERAQPNTPIKLEVAVRPGSLRSYLRDLATKLDRKAVDAQLVMRNLKPWLTKDRPGVRIEQARAAAAITNALERRRRSPLQLPAEKLAPKVTRSGFGPVIVIHRGTNHLLLYDGMRLVRTFGVATGQSAYPTPVGRFAIVVKWRNPWWYPPPSPWAVGEKPTPPGPGNPLGTRWMGLSAPGVGIHGTPNSASIGYSLSHGCIRMLIPEAEWLFDHVEVGTPVFVVAS